MRLDKFICKSTELTKAEAIQYVHAGGVTVNDEVILSQVVNLLLKAFEAFVEIGNKFFCIAYVTIIYLVLNKYSGNYDQHNR